MENLEKSVQPVVVVKLSFWKTYRTLVMGTVLAFSLFFTWAFYQSFRQEEKQHDYFAQMWTQDEQTIKNLQRELASHDQDLHQVMGLPRGEASYGEADVFQLSTRAWVDVNRACRKDPSSLYIAPEAIVSDRWMNIQNPEPLRNEMGVWFGPGDTCKVESGGWFRLTPVDNGERFVARVEYQKPDDYDFAYSCPNGSYILVLAKNKIVNNAVFRGCFQRTKFRQIGLVH